MTTGRGSHRRRRPEGAAWTGLGVVCALGTGIEPVTRALRELEADAPLTPRAHRAPATIGAASPGHFPLFRSRPDEVEAVLADAGVEGLADDRELRLAAAALELAQRDAGGAPPGARDALVATWEAPGLEGLLESLVAERLEQQPARAEAGNATPKPPLGVLESFFRRHRERAYATHSFLHLHSLARAFGIHGPTYFINNACASGLHALALGSLLLGQGAAERVFVVAAESPLFPAKHCWFQEGGLAAIDGVLRPFDRNRAGLVLGEGAAAVVLEPHEPARARGARVWARTLGEAQGQEGYKVTIPDLTGSHHEQTVRAALRCAGVEPADIDVVLVHGAGTGLSDAYEARGLRAVFGAGSKGGGRAEAGSSNGPRFTALKGCLGHTLGASALLETAALLGAVAEGFVPSPFGFETLDPRLGIQLSGGPARGVRRILKVANGFAGFNAALVLEPFADPGGSPS